MRRISNLPALKTRRRELRSSLTPAEAKLWTYLSRNQLGRKFRRQHSILNFILDFYCPSERLAIELDGDGHFSDEGMAYDEARTNELNKYNIRVIRFENFQVFDNIDEVLDEIRSNFRN